MEYHYFHVFLTASDCRFGSGCAFPCRCRDDTEACDSDTGFCSSGCKQGLLQGTDWYGPGCIIGKYHYIKYHWMTLCNSREHVDLFEKIILQCILISVGLANIIYFDIWIFIGEGV